jgi:hypothetical protein
VSSGLKETKPTALGVGESARLTEILEAIEGRATRCEAPNVFRESVPKARQ